MNSDEIRAFEKETEPLNKAIVWYRINLRPTNSSELKNLLESPEETVNAELDKALRSLDLDLDRSHPDSDLGRNHQDLNLSHSDLSYPDSDSVLDSSQLDSSCQNEIRTLLTELRVPELKRLTKEFNYDIPSNLNKAELIDTLVTMRPTTKSVSNKTSKSQTLSHQTSKASQKAGSGSGSIRTSARQNQNPIHLTLALNKITELAEKLKLLKADQKLPNKYQKSIQRCNALVNKVAKRYLQNSTQRSSKYKSLMDTKQAKSQQAKSHQTKSRQVKSQQAKNKQATSKFFSQNGGDIWLGVGIVTGALALFALVALLWRRRQRQIPTKDMPPSSGYGEIPLGELSSYPENVAKASKADSQQIQETPPVYGKLVPMDSDSSQVDMDIDQPATPYASMPIPPDASMPPRPTQYAPMPSVPSDHMET